MMKVKMKMEINLKVKSLLILIRLVFSLPHLSASIELHQHPLRFISIIKQLTLFSVKDALHRLLYISDAVHQFTELK
jgi:hypothetical protein